MVEKSNDNRNFRLALPKKGRLKDDFDSVFAATGLTLEKQDIRHDFGMIYDSKGLISPFETVIQRPGDALANLSAGVVDLAVVGLDCCVEFNAAAAPDVAPLHIKTILPTVSRCALCIAGPDHVHCETPGDLHGRRIATTFPALLQRWLDNHNVTDCTIIERGGGVEDTIRLGLADVICDLVQSGASLKANGLEIKFRVLESSAALIARPGVWSQAQSQIAEALINRVQSQASPCALPAQALHL